MKRLALLISAAALCSIPAFAGEFLMNEEVAYGLRVTFSEPVTLTHFGDLLTEVSPQGEASVFTFSGAELPAWVGHGLAWTPASARIASYEWLPVAPSAAPQGSAASEIESRPTITGDLLNPDYFAHGACVMQGVDDPDEIFAMPLLGVEELAFWPVAEGVDPATVTWTIEESTGSQGIRAEIWSNTLYIWGLDPSWAGYGDVTVSAAVKDRSTGTVTIPVTVFQQDKTLINSEGKKDYFVPWSPALDVNRILSVEEHMRVYDKGEGNLDRSITWSRWKRMELKKEVELATFWENEKSSSGVWPRSSQFVLVDVLLADLRSLGVNGISFLNEYYIESGEDTDIVPLWYGNLPGPSKDPEEEAYLINEAHRLGMRVTVGNFVSVGNEHEWAELFYASPVPLNEFFTNFEALSKESIERWARLGVDCVEPTPVLASLNGFSNSRSEASVINDAISRIANAARNEYPGPLMHGSGYGVNLFPGQPLAEAPFHQHFDVLGMGGWNLPRLTEVETPTLGQLTAGWEAFARDVLAPFQRRWDKPVILWEVGCPSVAGCSNFGTVCIQLPFYSSAQQSIEDMEMYFRSNQLALADLDGYYGTRWSWFPLSRYDTGSAADRGMNFRLKIEDVVQEAFLGHVESRLIEIDGDLSDWDHQEMLVADAVGDSQGRNDILGMYFAGDNDYYYFRVDYTSNPSGYLTLELDLTGDSVHEMHVLVSNVGDDWWWNEMIYPATAGSIIGFADAMDSSTAVEMRVPIPFLAPHRTANSIRVRASHADSNWRLEDRTAWSTLPGT